MLRGLYAGRDMDAVRARYGAAIEEFEKLYGKAERLSVFSVAGRSEICGNHTDHNHGKVLAASIDLDIIAVAAKTDDGTIRIKSAGFPEDAVDTASLSPVEAERGKSSALIRGVCDGFAKNGHAVGGFVAYTTSDILGGSGLSSSAAFEDMVGTILNHFYNDGQIGYMELSQISQYAENAHFGKPCGLMDQVACAAGGFVYIDFGNSDSPAAERVELNLAEHGYSLCIVNTGGSHANLTDDYAAVPAEMKRIAAFFGKPVLRGITKEELLQNAAALRQTAGDRAVLRALHYYDENARVLEQAAAIRGGDLPAFFDAVNRSGESSWKLLQNVYARPTEEQMAMGIELSRRFLHGDGAQRVHGGGFAGTIQAYVPLARLADYKKLMEDAFGAGSCTALMVRPEGAVMMPMEAE